MLLRVGLRLAAVCFLLFAGTLASAEEKSPVDFERDVAPLLQARCLRCHTPGNAKGDISLATPADLLAKGHVVPEDSAASDLIELVSAAEGEPPRMPREGTPLSTREIELLRRWIDDGAKWPEGRVLREQAKADRSWWSLRPLSEAEPPPPQGIPAAWRVNPIDRFIFARLAADGLTPNPPADRRTLIRRATYDLTGLPPAPEEVAAFVADDAPDAYERLLDRLLESPRYGEHWGRHWLDVIRFGESRGFERNEIINNLWPFRDYVIRSFNDDKPFDRLIREHLAGDVIGKDDPAVEIGVAFLVSGPYDDVGNQDAVQAAQIRADTIDEVIRATSEAFLGLTVGCARCHDHKFDPILQEDYYRLYATFAGVRHGERIVATAAQRRTRDEQLRPLNEQHAALVKRRDALLAAIQTRAEGRARQIETSWSRDPVSRQGTEETFSPVQARFIRLVVEGQEQNPQATTGYRIEEFEVWTADESPRNVALAANGGRAEGASRVAGDFEEAYSARLTIDGKHGACWIASGPELTITLAEPMMINRVVFCSDRTGAAVDHSVANFVSDYRLLVSLDGSEWIEVANSHDRRPVNEAHRRKRLFEAEVTPVEREQLAAWNRELAEVSRAIAAIPPLPTWWVGNFQEAKGPFHIFLGGSPQRAGTEVTAGSLSFLADVAPGYERPAGIGEAQRRLALADGIVHPANPLTRRVLANRLWQYHFGTGIVATSSDFGFMGSRPTHPELLDWLAGQVAEHGWKLKPLHKLIMLSQTYRQASNFRPQAAAVDADARLLWRYPPRRLTAEELRDTMLSVSGKLDLRTGGPGFRLYQYLQDNVATYVPLDEHGPATYRRAVYHQNARAARVDLMAEFDSPDCAFATPVRAETTTPLQALTLLNHDFTLKMAAALAERVENETVREGTEAQVRRAFQLCVAREPTGHEIGPCIHLVDSYGLKALCRVLLNTTEFIHIR